MSRAVAVAVCPSTLCEQERFRSALAGEDVRWNDSGRRLVGEELAQFIEGAARVVVGLERIDAALVARSTSLRVVAKFGVGLDNLDLDALEAAGVEVGWTPGVNRRAVAELAIGGMIALLRDLPEGDRRIRDGALAAGSWRPGLGRLLVEQHVGVVGCGHAGIEVARLLRALGARVSGNDVRDRRAHLEPLGVPQVELDALCREADIVTLHTPLDPSTRGLIDRARLERLRRGAIVVNTARGELIDEAALRDALSSGQVGGAFLDVLTHEPATPSALVSHPRVLVSAHVGGRTDHSIAAMADAALRNLRDPMSVSDLRARLEDCRIEPSPT